MRMPVADGTELPPWTADIRSGASSLASATSIQRSEKISMSVADLSPISEAPPGTSEAAV